MFIVFPRIRLRVSVFAIPIFLLMLWLEGLEAFIVIMLSAAVHELGHLFMIKRLGYRIRRFDLMPMGAVIVVPEGIPDNDEFKIALSGPFSSLIMLFLSAVCFCVFYNAVALLAVLINLVLSLFNLLPIKKLDGGKALWCYLSDKQKNAERICSAASLCAKIVFLIVSFALYYLSECNFGVLILLFSLNIQLLGK